MSAQKKIRNVRLVDGCDARRYLAWLVKQVESDRICPDKAKALNSIMRTFLKAVEVVNAEDALKDIIDRLDRLEADRG
jgi:hypothetical protein